THLIYFFVQAEDGIRDPLVTGVQTCALPIFHPLLDWTEINIWEYIRAENIPIIDLYFDKGEGTRYRSLGCAPCTFPIKSTAKTVDEIIEELRNTTVAERSGRAQDEGRGMEILRKDGYM